MKPKKQERPAGELRRSQVITTYGPGAMVELPDRSVLIGGLGRWHGVNMQDPIVEERLQAKVAQILDVDSIRFFPPPIEKDEPRARPAHIGVVAFPSWFLAQVDQNVKVGGRDYRTRPLVRAEHLDKGKWIDVERKRWDVVPVRFVQACSRGHISDIDWYRFAGADWSEQLWLDEGGAGNDFGEIFIRRESNNVRRPLKDATVAEGAVLGMCFGLLPWIGPRDQEDCGERNRLLIRTASNAYFPQIISAISIPDADVELREAVEKVWDEFLQYAEDEGDVTRERRKERVKVALETWSDADVWREVTRRRRGGGSQPQRKLKDVEIETLRVQPPASGGEIPAGDFYARSRDLGDLAAPFRDMIDRIVLVHRLREVVAQVGFTRFEAITPDVDGELAIGVERARLAMDLEWVPAIENRGEGVFIGFSRAAIEAWADRPTVRARGEELLRAFDRHNQRRGRSGWPVGGLLPYYMLHTLSHMLITAVSLACGYSSSSIRERIYSGDAGYGILLYTGASGSEGTLGGLVDVGRRIEDHLGRALINGRLCSNDPVCAQHDPENEYEQRFVHGAACHGCVLIPETCCERFNELLDRALVVPTVSVPDAAFFGNGDTVA